MKTKLTIVIAAIFCRSLLLSAEASAKADAGDAPRNPSRASTLLPPAASAQPACCPACPADAKPVAAKDACCAAEIPATPAPKLTAGSLYQLDAAWTNDAGARVQLTSLHGRPVVLAMFFASCEYACPIIVDDMKRLGALLPADVRASAQFVLISFDTARDTSAALNAYRERMKLDANWTLLRGDEASVQELAMLLGVKFKQDARGQFSHSNIITILSPAGEIAHQRAGLMGDVSGAAKAVALVAAAK